MAEITSNCPPPPRLTCPGGCMPGQCLNASCDVQLHDSPVLGHPDIEHEANLRRQCIDQARLNQEKDHRQAYFAESRRQMGMEKLAPRITGVPGPRRSPYGACNMIDYKPPKSPEVALKPMRMPVRPSCMLEPPTFHPPTDDYNDLSRFLRISTMPGYSNNEFVSESHDSYNLAVWNNRKDVDPQVYKVKRDWLSVWGEFNVKEQNWRRAWAEKFGAPPK